MGTKKSFYILKFYKYIEEHIKKIKGEYMNKLFYFLMVGLSLLAFQVVDVEAQRGDPRAGGDMIRP
jgi:hypothetical protein